jgi:archaeal type IV pilus assembly protein PilA
VKMRKLAKNTKALSPVIATIILVAVTVAIAIAVAAWLGALTFTYTNVEQLNITGATITAGTGTGAGNVLFALSNSGTSDVVIASLSVTGGSFSNTAGTMSTGTTGACVVTNGQASVPKGTSCTLTANFGTTPGFAAGTTYAFKLVSTKGNSFPYTTTA